MSKELGKQLTKTQLFKITSKFYLTKHAQLRLKERTNISGETFNKVLENLQKAMWNCAYAYNNNDGSVNIILKSGETIVVAYSDEYKRWQIITIKGESNNGYSNIEKWDFAKLRTTKHDRHKNRTRMSDRKETQHTKIKKPYKRDNSWKGEW